MGRAEAEAGDFDRLEPSLGNGASKPLRYLAWDRQQRGDRLTIEAGERVAERRDRRGIQPLDVVDRDAERTVAGESSHGCGGNTATTTRSSASTSVSPSSKAASRARRWIGGRSATISSAPPSRWPTQRTRSGSRLPRVERTGFGSRGSMRGLDSGLPERRLADSCFAGQNGGARKLIGGVEEPDDDCDFLVPSDKLPGRSGHVAILSQLEAVIQWPEWGDLR